MVSWRGGDIYCQHLWRGHRKRICMSITLWEGCLLFPLQNYKGFSINYYLILLTCGHWEQTLSVRLYKNLFIDLSCKSIYLNRVQEYLQNTEKNHCLLRIVLSRSADALKTSCKYWQKDLKDTLMGRRFKDHDEGCTRSKEQRNHEVVNDARGEDKHLEVRQLSES